MQRFPQPFEMIANVPVTNYQIALPMATDQSANLYVVTNNGIAVYASGQTLPFLTIPMSGGVPTGVAVDTSGNVYATVIGSTNGLFVFHQGQTEPFETIAIPNPYFVALDGSGDLFLTESRASASGAVAEIPAGSKTPKLLALSGVTFPVGLAVSPAGDLYVSDAQLRKVLAFHPGSKRPFRLISAHDSPLQIAFDLSGNLYVSEDELAQVAIYKPGAIRPFKLVRIGLLEDGAGGRSGLAFLDTGSTPLSGFSAR